MFILAGPCLHGIGLHIPPCLAYERINPKGPMAIRNQMPLYLFWYAFPQQNAQVASHKKFITTVDYTVSNVIIDKSTWPGEEYIVKADMEINRYNLDVRYGILDNLEINLEVPYLVLSKGYLDDFVEDFENAIGATSVGARKKTESRQFNYTVQHNYKVLIDTKSPANGIGDVAIGTKYMLLDELENLPRISIRGAVKLPAASKDKYLGSGEFDYGLGLLFDKSCGRFLTYLNLNTIFIEKPSFLSELNIKNYILSGMLGFEYCFTERFSAILQGTWHSTPYPDTGIDPLDNDAIEIGLGLNYQFTMNSNWHIAVVENGMADSTPDVTFQLGGRIKF
ncbi:MAG: DUF3187 family protein [Candidatus Omnitrophica bacterium]|nr:DUF3187 family protein [Candidatus Omnitrophota bacterium]